MLASQLLVLLEGGLEVTLDVGERRRGSSCGSRVLGAGEGQGMGEQAGRPFLLRLRFIGL